MIYEDLQACGAGNRYYDLHSQLQRDVFSRMLLHLHQGDTVRDGLDSAEAVQARGQAVRQAFLKSIGGLPEGGPLNARVMGSVREQGLTIEKVIFESRPGIYVTALLYLPDNRVQPAPAVQFLCGHSELGKLYPRYQRVCRILARAGLIVLAQDPVGQGERFSYDQQGPECVPPCVPDHMQAGLQSQMLGQNIGRYFLHDAMRGIDYLLSRPEVDAHKIGVTGNSGGGTQTTLMMMGDTRIAAAAPGTYIMDKESYLYTGQAQDMEQIHPGLIGDIGWDFEDIFYCMFPKPVWVLAAMQDFFPIEGALRTVSRARRAWDRFADPSHIGISQANHIHQYSDELARAAAAFFTRVFLGAPVFVDTQAVRLNQQDDLTVLGGRQVREALPGARFVFEETQQERARIAKQHTALGEDARRRQAMAFLDNAVYRGRQAIPFYPRSARYGQCKGDGVIARQDLIFSRPRMQLQLMSIRPESAGNDSPLPATLMVWEGGTANIVAHRKLIQAQLDAGRQAIVLDMTGAGAALPHPITDGEGEFASLSRLNMDMLFMGDSLMAMRIHDVCRAMEYLRGADFVQGNPCILADGWGGIAARLAAALAMPDKLMVTASSPKGYGDFVDKRYYARGDVACHLLPGLLAHADVEDFERWMAGQVPVERIEG
nr:acetylxylan esterase [bacterium]